jgi:hypothetical protein
MNKEQIYDEKINPLLAQIIEICKTHGIAMLASFSIPTPEQADLLCTSLLPDGDGNSFAPYKQALRTIKNGGESFAAFTITKGTK